MPSVFGHEFTGFAAGSILKKKVDSHSLKKILIASFLAANFPDFDVVFHHLKLDHIEYLNHRYGFFHSVFFLSLVGP